MTAITQKHYDTVAALNEARDTLRDRFAMAALTGILAPGRALPAIDYARAAYLVADAMMTARQPKEG